MDYYISDIHFGHKKVSEIRGFKNVDDHDDHIIDCWNKIIQQHDRVFILGDVSTESKKHYHLLDKLNGSKHIILGNHDHRRNIKELMKHVSGIYGVRYKTVDNIKMIITHVPVHPIEFNRCNINIHGHLHEIVINDNRYFNVSCERLNYTPISETEIIKYFKNIMI